MPQAKSYLRKGPASPYASPRELIREFPGGLLSIRFQGDGTTVVELYRLDGNVKVRVPPANLEI